MGLLNWLSVKYYRNEMRSCMADALSLPEFERKAAATHLLGQILRIEQSKPLGRSTLRRVLREIVVESALERERAVNRGARTATDPLWFTASLVDLWAVSHLGAIKGPRSAASFGKIHAVLFNFVTDTLGQDELAYAFDVLNQPRAEGNITYYMPQDLFNCIALTLALKEFAAVRCPEAASKAEEDVRGYVEFYKDDLFLPEARRCASITLDWVAEQCSSDQDTIQSLLDVLSDAVLKYEPNGRRKIDYRYVNLAQISARSAIPNRSRQYIVDLGLYYMNVQTGRIG